MKTKIVEATNGKNFGKFLLAQHDEAEWSRRSEVNVFDGKKLPLLHSIGTNPRVHLDPRSSNAQLRRTVERESAMRALRVSHRLSLPSSPSPRASRAPRRGADPLRPSARALRGSPSGSSARDTSCRRSDPEDPIAR
jgi:hypothetical protein